MFRLHDMSLSGQYEASFVQTDLWRFQSAEIWTMAARKTCQIDLGFLSVVYSPKTTDVIKRFKKKKKTLTLQPGLEKRSHIEK